VIKYVSFYIDGVLTSAADGS